jgi:hypothetical protein
MKGYKRNQVEEAIAVVIGVTKRDAITALRSQLKRLLDTDRNLPSVARECKSSSSNLAFYSDASPGKGADVEFSAYEAFALLTGLRFLEHAWPQGFVVRALKYIRPSLEGAFARIIKLDPSAIFDKQALKTAPCPFGSDNTRPCFLLVATSKEMYPDGLDDRTAVTLCEGASSVSAYLGNHRPHSWTTFELTTSAHRLAEALSATLPRTRGRN